MRVTSTFTGTKQVSWPKARLPIRILPWPILPCRPLPQRFSLNFFGYHFELTRFWPIFWAFSGGLILAILVRAELGGPASIFTSAFFLLSYETLRASSHFTGVNMTVALFLFAVYAYRRQWTLITAAFCVFAVFTRLYALPCVVVLLVFAIFENWQRGLRLFTRTVYFGSLVFILIVLWGGFGNVVENLVTYQALKTAMKSGQLEMIRNTVLFHNAPLALATALSFLALLAKTIAQIQNSGEAETPALVRLRAVLTGPKHGLLYLSLIITTVVLLILMGLKRVHMYYFVLVFPFAAVLSGWLLAGWWGYILALARPKRKMLLAGSRPSRVFGGAVLFVLFAVGYWQSPKLENNLPYFERAMQKTPPERIHNYTWQPGFLPPLIDEAVKKIIWRDTRIIGERYSSFTFLLWHESRVLDIVDEVVATIESNTSDAGKIFGDASTVPLFALKSGRAIAANEVDTNIQRYRSKVVNPNKLIDRIDKSDTELIILRHNFGVAGLPEVIALVQRKYKHLKSVKTAQGKLYDIFKR